MNGAQRRALLGDEVVEHIHDDVQASIAAYGIPDDLILELRRIFAPVVESFRARQFSEAA